MTASAPLISVVVPVYNDPDGIAITLESITNQTYSDTQYEILVVDNGSTDNTRGVIQSCVERYPELVTLVVEDDIQGRGAARNAGIEAASGSVFAFIDADMTVNETWLASVAESFQNDDHDYMGCAVETYPPDGHETLGTRYDSVFRFDIQRIIEKSKYSGAGCLVVRKNVFDTVGLFDNRLLEDREFGQRVHEAGFELHYEPSITMYHPARSSAIEQIEKNFRVGRGTRQLHEIYPDRFEARNPFSLRQFLPIHPHRFYDRIDDKNGFTNIELIELYLFSWLNKLASSSGSLYEYIGTILENRIEYVSQ